MIINWTEATALATTALVVTSGGAILYAGLQLRHEREYRAVANLEKQLTFFHSDKFREARRRLAVDRLAPDGTLVALNREDPPISAFEVLDFYEHLGLLLKKGHLHLYDIWHTFYEWVQPVYADMQPLFSDPASEWADHYSDLRTMVHAMDHIQRDRMKRRRTDAHMRLWSAERIADHYRYEIDANGDAALVRRLRVRAMRPAA